MSPDEVLAKEVALRREADEILMSRGLRDLLTEYGDPRIEGSYVLRLMAWRDLDIYLVREELSVASFFELGGQIAELMNAPKMNHRNEHIAQSPDLPRGLYWGVYLGDERAGAWKIDVWAVQSSEYERLTEVRREIQDRLSDGHRVSILEIKNKCWKDPRYRKAYSSMDVYRAVINDGVQSFSRFDEWLREHKGFGVVGSGVGEA